MRIRMTYFKTMSRLWSSPPFHGGDRGGSNRSDFTNLITSSALNFQEMDDQLLTDSKLIEGFTFIQLKGQVKEALKRVNQSNPTTPGPSLGRRGESRSKFYN
jgi:hypothetical protein